MISGTSNPSTFTATPGACGGPVTETWTATDACGRTVAAVSRTITVSPAALPAMTAPAPVTVACGGVPAASTISFSNGLTGNCLISGTSNPSTFTATPVSGCGTVKETWESGNDACGRAIASVSRIITVVDNTAPLITCTSSKVVNTNNTGCTYKQTSTIWDATATDNCSSTSIKYTLSGATASAVNAFTTLNNVVFNSGITTVSAIATDACNNTSIPCTFTVSVSTTLTAACTHNTTDNTLYFGYSGDQTETIKVTPTGGQGPYTIQIKMSRPLLCNQITLAGDEIWTPGAGVTSTSGIVTCPASGTPDSMNLSLVPVSAATGVAAGGSFAVTVTLMRNADIIATITDAYGCTYICTTKIHAEDVRCFAGNSGNAKVTICHKTGSTKNPCVTICVDESAVNEHLSHGDFLGQCTTNCTAPVITARINTTVVGVAAEPTVSAGKLTVKVMPNPASYFFTMAFKSESKEKIKITVVDVIGRVIEKRQDILDNSTIQLGHKYYAGVYFAEIRQGKEKVTVRLIKGGE